jgi:hypothetical protein
MNKKTPFLAYIVTLLISIMAFHANALSASGVIKVAESTITSSALRQVFDSYYYLNGLSFQQDAITTHNGWQYAVFYNSDRYVTVARRQLPAGKWELLSLTDYRQSTNDSHNTISIGIAPGDGTIHLAFDHHSSNLHYRKSIPDLTTNPGKHSWADSLFGPVTNRLVSGIPVGQVTYPRFFSTPQGDLQFEARIGTSGDGESYLWEYQCSTGEWTSLGKFVDNPKGGNAYLHGIQYDETGRLHTTWVKRETPDASTNHDLYYTYSDDNGRTWRNNSGDSVGTTGTDPVTIEEPKVWTIPTNSGLINQEAQTIDHQGRIHVFQRKNVSGRNYQFHYWRDTDGTWHETNTGIRTGIWYQRSKIAVDSDNNVYAIMPDLLIASASASSQWSDWTVVDSVDDNRFYSEPLYDWSRLYHGDGILSVVYQERASGNLMVLDYQLNLPSSVEIKRTHIVPDHFSLKQNYPNPFNPPTTIRYSLSAAHQVNLTVFDITGREVAVLVNEHQAPGSYTIRWNAGHLASGVYLYGLTAGDFSDVKRMALVK